MYTSKTVLIIVSFIAAINQSFGQAGSDTVAPVKKKQSVVIYAGGGFASYLSGIPSPANLKGNITKTNPIGSIRVMWHPGFRLNLGLQSGLTNFYSYDVTSNNLEGNLRLSAVPILAVWSMPIVKNLEIFAGFGSYLLTSHLDYKEKVTSSTFSLGTNVALSYTKPLSKNLGLAAEAEWMNAFETKDNSLALKIQLVWKAFEF